MAESKDTSDVFVKVTDRIGKEYICPLDALKDVNTCTEEELKNCLDSAEEAFSDNEILAIIKADIRKE
jgi:hypothetical protein